LSTFAKTVYSRSAEVQLIECEAFGSTDSRPLYISSWYVLIICREAFAMHRLTQQNFREFHLVTSICCKRWYWFPAATSRWTTQHHSETYEKWTHWPWKH